MRITRNAASPVCAVCERTLLLGERATRFAPDEGGSFVEVCALCHDAAAGHGWVKEGSPTSPSVRSQPRRRRSLGALFDGRRAEPTGAPVAAEPVLRRLSEPELLTVEAADLFNSSPYRRTVEGIAKSLGEPSASIVPLSGTNAEMVVTVAWDISWYQYRVTFGSIQPLRLAERGHDLDEIDPHFRVWNARLEPDGRLVPAVARG